MLLDGQNNLAKKELSPDDQVLGVAHLMWFLEGQIRSSGNTDLQKKTKLDVMPAVIQVVSPPTPQNLVKPLWDVLSADNKEMQLSFLQELLSQNPPPVHQDVPPAFRK